MHTDDDDERRSSIWREVHINWFYAAIMRWWHQMKKRNSCNDFSVGFFRCCFYECCWRVLTFLTNFVSTCGPNLWRMDECRACECDCVRVCVFVAVLEYVASLKFRWAFALVLIAKCRLIRTLKEMNCCTLHA